ncbi:aldo/keto reductase [Mesorhizobium caraganae]|uniref:aldo/keto reductase n=1 Tax=Mesorhizobium caraganae TaxID=483206 RepID=UPI0035E3D1CC
MRTALLIGSHRSTPAALNLGFRIDTAQSYENASEVGKGLLDPGVRRDSWRPRVTSIHFAPRDLERSVRVSLGRMPQPHLGLLLLHGPNPCVPLAETPGALEQAKGLGLTQHVGVSNFNVGLGKKAVRTLSGAISLQSG